MSLVVSQPIDFGRLDSDSQTLGLDGVTVRSNNPKTYSEQRLFLHGETHIGKPGSRMDFECLRKGVFGDSRIKAHPSGALVEIVRFRSQQVFPGTDVPDTKSSIRRRKIRIRLKLQRKKFLAHQRDVDGGLPKGSSIGFGHQATNSAGSLGVDMALIFTRAHKINRRWRFATEVSQVGARGRDGLRSTAQTGVQRAGRIGEGINQVFSTGIEIEAAIAAAEAGRYGDGFRDVSR